MLAGCFCVGEGDTVGSTNWGFRVQEVRATWHLALESDIAKHRNELRQTSSILFANRIGDIVVVEGRYSRLLDSWELAAVTVVFNICKRGNKSLVPADPTDAPADHVKALTHRVDFDSNILRSVDRQETQRIAVERQTHVGSVLYDNKLMLLR